MEKHDLREYRLSKLHCDNLKLIIKILDLTKRGLTPFRIYSAALKVYNVVDEQKQILESHYEKYKKIKETKGKID